MGAEVGIIAPEQEEEFGRLLAFYRKNWAVFIRDVLQVKLEPKQEEVVSKIQNFDKVEMTCAHGVGKTLISACLVLTVTSLWPYAVVFSTAPTDRQVKNLLWEEIGRRYANSLLPALGYPCPLTKAWNLAAGWQAFGAASDEPMNLEGLHSPTFIFLLYDEAKGIPKKNFEALSGALNAPISKELLATTPGPKGEHWERHAGSKKHMYQHVHATAWEVPRLVEWAQARKEEWGEDSPVYRIRVMAEYCDEALMKIFTDTILRKFKENASKVSKAGERILGVDVARFGVDNTVFTYRYGGFLDKQEKFHGKKSPEIADLIVDRHKRFGISRVVIDSVGGYGAGVLDSLEEKGFQHQIEPFSSTTSAFDPGMYFNRKTEALFKIVKAIEEEEIGGALSDELEADLRAYDYCITKKEQYHALDPEGEGNSPDFGDSFMFAFAVDSRQFAACVHAWDEAEKKAQDEGVLLQMPMRRTLMEEAENGRAYTMGHHKGRISDLFR